MKSLIKLKTTTLLVIPLVLAGFALLPSAQAATPELLPAPAPDGAYLGFNTAEGLNALFNVNTAVGQFNTALGFAALKFDTTGAHNTGVGGQALLNNNGSFNTAVGENALVHNTLGSMNMALGQGALQANTTASGNTAMGFQALNNNIVGTENTAVGFQALRSTNGTTGFLGSFNTAIGDSALVASTDTTGANTAIGSVALSASVTGFENTAVGRRALENSNGGSGNTALGWRAGDNVVGASNVICIGANVPGTNTSNSCFIGNIFGQAGGAQAVYVNAAGKLGFISSSRRFKDEIKPMDKTSEAIYALKPVSFRYKAQIEPSRPLSFGLIAEDVAKISPALVQRGRDGQVNTVRYESINAMLLNEFLKEHQKVQELEATVAQQQKGMEALVAQVKEQAAQIQKVSAQVETSKPTPKVVANQ
jgi:trimeric autotransporter adhesin